MQNVLVMHVLERKSDLNQPTDDLPNKTSLLKPSSDRHRMQ